MRQIIFAIAALASHVVSAAPVEDGEWIEVESFGESASGAAVSIGTEISKKLKAERSKIVFLDIRDCHPGFSEAESWCSTFQASLESFLVNNGIRFLPESARDEVRRNIADEQVYQHNSMQVDVDKAVQLGQQKAFQAFLAVIVTGDGKGMIQVAAKSVSIKDAVVTVSESKAIRYQKQRSRSWGTLTKGWLMTGGGIGIMTYGLVRGHREGLESEKSFDRYKKADNPNDATDARRDVEKSDKRFALYMDVAAAGSVLALAGGVYFLINRGDETMQYKVLSSNDRLNGSAGIAVSLSPEVFQKALGVSLALEW